MELTKIRSLSDDELLHQEKTSAEQLFRLRFQVSMGQNDGVKKLRQLRKEIAQIKTVSRERELGVRGAQHELVSTLPASEEKKSAAKKTVKKTVKKKAAKPAKGKSGAKKSVKKGPRSSAKKSAKKSAAASAKKKGAGK